MNKMGEKKIKIRNHLGEQTHIFTDVKNRTVDNLSLYHYSINSSKYL